VTTEIMIFVVRSLYKVAVHVVQFGLKFGLVINAIKDSI